MTPLPTPLGFPRPFKGPRRDLHAALLAEVDAHPGQVPCVIGQGSVDWFSPNNDEQRAAAARCADCPAFAACAAYVSGHPREAGVWAGTTEQDREQRAATWRAIQQTKRAAS